MSRTTASSLLWSAAACTLAAGCGANGRSLDGEVGTYGPDASGAFTAGADGGAQPLDAYIEQGHVAVRLVTLSCAGGCVTVQAVGTGGRPPYTYAWQDGSTQAVRRVCPTSATSYTVAVTDTGETGEFPVPEETARASLTADVLACPDAGGGGATDCAPDDAADAGPLSPEVAWASWTGWSSVPGGTPYPGGAQGQISLTGGAVQVDYMGEVDTNFTSAQSDPWTASGYTSAAVADAPGAGIIALTGGSNNPGPNVIAFSRPVRNPVLAVFSVGSGIPPVTAEYVFTEPFTILSSGANSPLTSGPGNALIGTEGDGVIQFTGLCRSIQFTNPVYEDFSGFTVGVPEGQ